MKRSQASYTVEASILIPLILAVILALIQICFTAHDRVLLIEALEYTALRLAEEETEEYPFALEELSNRFLISEVTDVRVQQSKSRIELAATLNSRRLVPLYFAAGEGLSKEFRCKRSRPLPETKTILCEVLLDTVDDLKGKGKE